MASGRLLGSFFLALAVVSLIFFISLGQKDNDDKIADSFVIGQESERYYDFPVEEDASMEFTFDSTVPIDVILKDRKNGVDVLVAEGSTHSTYPHHFPEAGEQTFMFNNTGSEPAKVDITIVLEYEEDEGPRPFCGLFAALFFVIGIILRIRKRKVKKQSGPIIAVQTAPPAQYSALEDGSPKTPAPNGQRHSSFAPSTSADQPLVQGPAGGGSQTQPLNGHAPSESAVPMPDDTQGHKFQFGCPDCGTIIFINKKIKKVTCPKCSHSFRIQKS